MRYALLLLTLLPFCSNLIAADTTKIRTHDKVVIKTDPGVGFTEYATDVRFPDDSISYRKVYLYLEFGCAPGLKCGEWDYLNFIYLEKGGERYELSRFITPYGFYWNSSMNWKHGWYFDLTDYSYLLHDSAKVIYQHTGYEGNTDRGWTVTMDYTFVHGEAARIPVGLQTLHRLSVPFGNVSSPFSDHVPDKIITMQGNSDALNIKIIQTGHGMDSKENCAEFCSKTRTVKLDGNIISQKNVWRDDCGFNSLFPQAGTWIYDRAGWCPGASVVPDDIYLNLDSGSSHEISLNMQDYINNVGGSANYVLSTYAMFFKDNRKQRDAAIEDIISPSPHYEYLRLNPICGAPMIRVKNMGIETINAVEFEYGKLGGQLQKIWVPCDIKPFESQTLTLEAIYNWAGAGNTFVAKITKVNNVADDDYTEDNTMYSKISNATMFPNKIIIVFKSNSAPTENSYTLKDSRGKVIRSKNNFLANTIHRDTVFLDNNLCYTFEFSDEGTPPSSYPLNKDGLDFWAVKEDGSGYIQIRNGNNNTMLKNFNADFGTKHIFDFTTTFGMGINESGNKKNSIDVIPNPVSQLSETKIVVNVSGNDAYVLTVYDQTGKQVESFWGNEMSRTFVTEQLTSGIYTAVLIQGQTMNTHKFIVY